MHVNYPTVELRPVPDFPGYFACRIGVVFSTWIRNGRGPRIPAGPPAPMRASPNKDGHLFVRLSRNGDEFNKFIHTIILETFIGPKPPGMECRHLDDIKDHNYLSNLAWGTFIENRADMIRNGKSARGERNGRAKITDAQRAAILTSTEPSPIVARRFGLTPGRIRQIRRG